jgi:RNA polymerase sigma-70 factor (ECF subfamily)
MSLSPLTCVDCRDARCRCSLSRTVGRVTSGSPLERDPGAVSEATDEELATGLIAGDERCLEEAYRRWSPVIYTVALRALGSATEAEDVTQQVFVSGWRSRSGFQPEYGSLPGWLLGITKHRIMDRQRARARELRLVGAVEHQAGVDEGSQFLEGLVDELVLLHELRKLPPPRGTILQLAFWEGHSYPQIAERLDLPVGTVKSHARRALLQLRSRLQEVTAWSI